MAITSEELAKEHKILKGVLKKINTKLEESGLKLDIEEEKRRDFLNYAWENRAHMDSGELAALNTASSLEEKRLIDEYEYFKKLNRIKDNPYFASILFKEDNGTKHVIYIGLTYLKDKLLNNIIYD